MYSFIKCRKKLSRHTDLKEKGYSFNVRHPFIYLFLINHIITNGISIVVL